MEKTSRRNAIKVMGLGTACLLTGAMKPLRPSRKHIITLSYDDGFRNSSIRTAELYEKYRLSASINVIAAAHQENFKSLDAYQSHPVGDFELWNELQSRGHEIMPHGYKHANLRDLPFPEAQNLITKCMDIFSEELEGFIAKGCIFNFPYNASSPDLEEWLKPRVRAIRTGGDAINPIPNKGLFRLTCTSYGPGNIDKHLEDTIDEFLAGPSGWLIYNTHGIDDEGWGPVSEVFLDELLDRLSQHETAELLSVTQSLDQVSLTHT